MRRLQFIVCRQNATQCKKHALLVYAKENMNADLENAAMPNLYVLPALPALGASSVETAFVHGIQTAHRTSAAQITVTGEEFALDLPVSACLFGPAPTAVRMFPHDLHFALWTSIIVMLLHVLSTTLFFAASWKPKRINTVS